jgi:hypothetical protein
MCADSSMLFGILLFFVTVAASPFVIIAAIVHVCRKNKTDEIVRLLD